MRFWPKENRQPNCLLQNVELTFEELCSAKFEFQSLDEPSALPIAVNSAANSRCIQFDPHRKVIDYADQVNK